MDKMILELDQVLVMRTPTAYRVFAKIEAGGFVELKPFSMDQRGLVGAMLLVADILAGKFWPTQVIQDSPGQSTGPRLISNKT